MLKKRSEELKNPIQIKINIDFQDYIALALALISSISVPFFFPKSFYIYLLAFTLLLSIFVEKKVQILILVNSLIFLFTFRFFTLNILEISVINFILSSNSFISLFGLGVLFVVLSISIICNLTIVLKPKNQQYLDYCNTFSSVSFIVIALIYSVLIVQNNDYFVSSLVTSMEVNFSFLAMIYLCFTLIINLFYVSFSLIFLFFLAYNKIGSLVNPPSKKGIEKRVKKKANKKNKAKKSKDHKVRGV